MNQQLLIVTDIIRTDKFKNRERKTETNFQS